MLSRQIVLFLVISSLEEKVKPSLVFYPQDTIIISSHSKRKFDKTRVLADKKPFKFKLESIDKSGSKKTKILYGL